jgi:hypothetical protein
MIWLLLTIYFLNQKNGKFLCFIAGIAQLGDFLFYELNYYGVREVYCNNILRLKDTSVIIIMYLLIAIGAILLGFSSKSVKEHTTHNTKTALNHASSATASTESLAVRLEKLKELLDHGVITQQEFDEKKKQILDS